MMVNPHHLLEIAHETPIPRIEGQWQSIQLRPDFAEDELLNIGVLFTTPKAKQFKLLDTFDKFTHLYGDAATDELQFIVKALGASLSKGMDSSPLPSINFGDSKYARGSSIEEVIERLFSTSVTLSGPAHLKKRTKGKFLSTTDLRNEVFNIIKVQASINAERIIASDYNLLFSDSVSEVALDVPLQTKTQLGTVISAGFSTPENVERALLRGYIDLTTAMMIRGTRSSGFFVFKPDNVLANDKQLKVDNVVDIIDWKLKKVGINMCLVGSAEKLAEDVLSWAQM
jgi:hypothetical protein